MKSPPRVNPRAMFLAGAVALALVACSGHAKLTYMTPVPASAGTPTPEPGKALIVFMRAGRFAFLADAEVWEGDRFIGMLGTRTKVAWQVAPGEHHFMVTSEAADFMVADVVAGRTYYVLVKARPGSAMARFSFRPLLAEDLANDPRVQTWRERSQWVEPSRHGEIWADVSASRVAELREAEWERWLAKPDEGRERLSPDDGQ